jgi:hypothetical protein
MFMQVSQISPVLGTYPRGTWLPPLLFETLTSASHACCLIEAYRDEAAQQAHRETEHYKAYRATIVDLLAEPIQVTILNGVDVVSG